MISVQKLATNLMKGNKLGVVVKGLAEICENRLAVALKLCIAVDPARVVVTMCELVQCTEVHTIVSPILNTGVYGHACVLEREYVCPRFTRWGRR